MKSFLFLVYFFSVLGLILAQSLSTNSTTVDECQIYYSIIGNNDGSCCSSKQVEFETYAQCENGHITKINISYYFNEKEGSIKTFLELPNELFKLKNLKE
eukprot:jgi/Orpsp1_1/1189849/evm.model.d7180000074944.1